MDKGLLRCSKNTSHKKEEGMRDEGINHCTLRVHGVYCNKAESTASISLLRTFNVSVLFAAVIDIKHYGLMFEAPGMALNPIRDRILHLYLKAL